MKKIITNNKKETEKIGFYLGKKIKDSIVYGLIGGLGSGKTAFTQGLAKGLGVKENVNSPTFVLMRVYLVKNHPIIKQFVHVDAYRLNNLNDWINIGLNEYLQKKDIVMVIEWADKLKKLLPPSTKIIQFKHISQSKRLLVF